jgi:hypothetical protein
VPYDDKGKHAGKRFVVARWSPNGRYLAYVIQTPNAEGRQLGWQATLDDGLWVLDYGTPNAIPSLVMRNHYDLPYDTQLRMVKDIAWAPDNNAMMLTVQWPYGLQSVLVSKDTHADDHQPGLFSLIDFVGGTWQADSQGYIAASPPGNHPSILGIVHRDIGQITKLADGAQLQLWMQNPALLSDGRYAFLAKPSATGTQENGPTDLALYIMTLGSPPAAVSAPLPGAVLAAEWNPSRTALLVTLQTDQGVQVKVVGINGAIVDYTGQARGARNVHWAK